MNPHVYVLCSDSISVYANMNATICNVQKNSLEILHSHTSNYNTTTLYPSMAFCTEFIQGHQIWEFHQNLSQQAAEECRTAVFHDTSVHTVVCYVSLSVLQLLMTVDNTGKGFCLLTTSFWCWCEMYPFILFWKIQVSINYLQILSMEQCIPVNKRNFLVQRSQSWSQGHQPCCHLKKRH